MNQTLIGICGFVCMAAIMLSLFKSKTVPAVAFILFPTILGIFLMTWGYYSVTDIGNLIKAGFGSTAPTAALFVFSVLYFSVINEAGMFDVIVDRLTRHIGTSVIGVTMITTILTIVAHLDGSGASTFLIVIPAMLPIYRKMNMRTTTLLRVMVLPMGIMNLMPWAGPTVRAATVLGMEASDLWQMILPVQIFGVIICLAHGVLAGIQEKQLGAGLVREQNFKSTEVTDKTPRDKKIFIFNVLLTLAVIAALIVIKIPDYVPFMVGLSLALIANYGLDAKTHKKIINAHAAPALMMCSTLLAAAVLMGIFVKEVTVDGAKIPGVINCMSNLVTLILPETFGEHLPVIIGALSVPLALIFDTNSYFYGMLPVMIGIGENFAVSAESITAAMLICRNCATFISPMVPAALLGVGLAEVDIKEHIKASFGFTWLLSIICLGFAALIKIIPL